MHIITYQSASSII